jgi:hypothetical protein
MKLTNTINNFFKDIYFYDYPKIYSNLKFDFKYKKINKILELKQKIKEKTDLSKTLIIMPVGMTDIVGMDYRQFLQNISYIEENYFIFIGTQNNLDFIHTTNFIFDKSSFKEIYLPMSIKMIKMNVCFKIQEIIEGFNNVCV